MADAGSLRCYECGGVGFDDGNDGCFYCRSCGMLSQDVFDTQLQADGALDHTLYSKTLTLQSNLDTAVVLTPAQKPEPPPDADFDAAGGRLFSFLDEEEAAVAEDFGGGPKMETEAVAGAIRERYVMGVQVMVKKQCEVLVERFGVCPVVCGVAGPLWLRFVASSGVFRDEWADEAILDSEALYESQHGDTEAERESKTAKNKAEPENLFGERAATIWLKSLRKKIPLGSSLAICFLACHVAREAVLPNDILKWASEGKLFYLSAFNDMEKYIGSAPKSCPLTTRFMFRPSQVIGDWLEPMAGYIANLIHLQLPPVNFRLIATRFLTKLSLPIKEVLPFACRIYEWLMPPELWLSANEGRMPTRACVMSILIVAMRIRYSIHGFGMWEMSLSGKKHSQGSTSDTKTSMQESTDIICHLERIYYKLVDELEFSKNLSSYLTFCSDVVFAGIKASYEEENIAENIKNFYADHEASESISEDLKPDFCHHQKRERGQEALKEVLSSLKKKKQDVDSESFDVKESKEQNVMEQNMNCKASSSRSGKSPLVEGIEPLIKLKADMEENWFHYMPPRKYDKRYMNKYLAYHRNRRHNMLHYVAHADYYILLRACARVVKIGVKAMHRSVLKLERRLVWTENNIDQTFQSTKKHSSEGVQLNPVEVDDHVEDVGKVNEILLEMEVIMDAMGWTLISFSSANLWGWTEVSWRIQVLLGGLLFTILWLVKLFLQNMVRVSSSNQDSELEALSQSSNAVKHNVFPGIIYWRYPRSFYLFWISCSCL